MGRLEPRELLTHPRRADKTKHTRTTKPRGCAVRAVLAALIGSWRCWDLAGRSVLELFPAVTLGLQHHWNITGKHQASVITGPSGHPDQNSNRVFSSRLHFDARFSREDCTRTGGRRSTKACQVTRSLTSTLAHKFGIPLTFT